VFLIIAKISLTNQKLNDHFKYVSLLKKLPVIVITSKSKGGTINIEQPCFGVHAHADADADAGGGYGDQTETIFYPAKVTSLINHSAEQVRYEQRFKDDLEQKYHKPHINIQFDYKPHYRKTRGSVVRTKHLRIIPFWQRQIKKELAFVSLEKMHQHALSQGVPFKALNTLSNIPFMNQNNHLATYDYQASTELKQLVSQAEQYGTASAAYQTLYHQYIHHSHRYHSWTSRLANGIEKDPKQAFGHYGREIFYSKNIGVRGNENKQWQAYTDNSGVKRWFK